MTSVHHPGENTLLHIGIGYLDELNSSLGNEIKMPLVQAMSGYLRQQVGFEEAQQVFFSLIGRDEPLQNLRLIVEMPDEPLTFTETEISESEDSQTLRRKTRPWTALEDQRLLAGIYRFGLDNWTTISNFIGNGRTRAQCCQRWARGLNPCISKELWSYEEDLKLIDLVRTYGDKSWTKIASLMGNRSDVQCRYHYYQVQRDLPSLFQEPYNRNYAFPNIGPNGAMFIRPNLVTRSHERFSLPDITIGHPLVQSPSQPVPIPMNSMPQSPPVMPHRPMAKIPHMPMNPIPPVKQPSSRRPSLPLPNPTQGETSTKLSRTPNSTSSLDGFLRNFLN